MMKQASIQEIRQELQTLDKKELLSLCNQLAKYKKDNKEFLSYLLFDASDIQAYIQSIKITITDNFETINWQQVYYAKKSLRKILRIITKFVRFSGEPEVEVALLIHFCALLKAAPLPIQKYPVLQNIYQMQLKKIQHQVLQLHEDIQFEFLREVKKII
ncbi:MAG: hypothetical protein ACOYKE_04655 [Ferruginibacter sp.]